MTATRTVYLEPRYDNPDKADGGIRRVVEAQKRYLPEFGWTVAETKGARTEDLIESADLIATHAGIWVDAPRTKPIISHCHGLYWHGYEWEKWHHKLNQQVIYAIMRADHTTAPSHWVANALRRNFAVEPTTLWHGIEPDDWRPGVNGGYVLWNKARTDAICDPTPVIELAKMAQGTEFVTTFAKGDAPKNVRVTGAIPYDQAKDAVQNAGVYLATTRETFGVGTLEALACGVPVLAWNWGGQREIIRHMETGYLAEVGNYADLLEGLRWCLANRSTVSEAALADVRERWTWRKAIERYAKLYNRVLAEKAAENSRPRTSVIITNHNLGNYLPAAIDSVLAQTDQDFEIILVDDASTKEGESEVVEAQAQKDARVRVLRNETNLYLAESLNRGIGAASGRYILPLDADNTIAPNTLEVLANRLDQDRDADIAYGAVEFVHAENGSRYVSTWPPREFNFTDQLHGRNQLPSTSLYRKTAWARVGGYRKRYRTAEDADFWCRATSWGAKPVRATDAATLIYLDRPDSMSRVNKPTEWWAWCAWGAPGFEHLTPPAATVAHEKSFGADFKASVHAAEFPIVSIVIPVGEGHERTVFDAIDSIVAQTLPQWEIVVVNDSPNELIGLPSYVRKTQTFASKSGPAVARNKGMELARGEYYLFLDADDYLEPTALEKLVGYAKQLGPEYFTYGDWIHEEENRVVKTKEYDCAGLLKQLEYPVTALYPRTSWRASGGMDITFTEAWEDWDFALRIANSGFCGARLPEPVLHYRMASGKRREDGFAQRANLKKLVFEKWQDYIEGRKPLMACGACGSRRGMPAPYISPSAVSSGSMPAPEGATLIEYIGESPNVLTFYGKVSNRKYRFGSDPDHKTRYVDSRDVAGFLSLGTFAVVTADEPALAVV